MPDREETYCQSCGNAPDDGEQCVICGRLAPKPMIIIYELRLTIVRAIRHEDLDPAWTLEEHAEEMISTKVKRALEREVLQALRKIDGDCDCEVMDAIKTEDS